MRGMVASDHIEYFRIGFYHLKTACAVRALGRLARLDVRMVDRNRGSGTRLWRERQIELGVLPPADLRGYEFEVRTHAGAAQAVRDGRADAGLGLLAAARNFELDFIPLFQERFDLVFLAEQTNPLLGALLDHLSSGLFRSSVEKLAGYKTSQTGDEIRPSLRPIRTSPAAR